MNPAVISRAILTRLQADSTLYSVGAWTSALAGGAGWPKGNPATAPAFPNIVWGVDYNADNAFDGIMGEGTVTFAAYDLQSQGTTRLEVLIDRLIGDSMLASGNRTAPTYGFHNHPLALPSIGSTNVQGAVASQLDFKSATIGPGDTDETLTATVTFTIRTSNTAANP
jgi:hypothetical protein